jgi:hypothetical protein
MQRLTVVRIVSVLAGAATLFTLEQGVELSLYLAIPLAMVVYLAVKVGLGLAIGADGTK